MIKLKTIKLKKSKKKDLKKELDRVFSIFIRQRDKGICFTCNLKLQWKYQQNGHYVSRSYLNTRWDEQNCHCQCVGCNIFKKGNMDVYALRLIALYGKDILQELNKRKQVIKKFHPLEMESLIEHYKSLIH